MREAFRPTTRLRIHKDAGARDKEGTHRLRRVRPAMPVLRATSADFGRPHGRLKGTHDKVLDDRIRQQRFRDLSYAFQCRLVGGAVEFELEPLALPYSADAVEPHLRQLPGDRLALGIQDLRLEHDLDHDASHGRPLPDQHLYYGSEAYGTGTTPTEVTRATGRF